MRSKTSRKWSKADDKYLRKNISDGTIILSVHFGVTQQVIRRRCSTLCLSLRTAKADVTTAKETKADNSEKFNHNRHKIKNNSTAGLIPLWIGYPDRMIVYHKPGADIEAIKQKYANRHKPIV